MIVTHIEGLILECANAKYMSRWMGDAKNLIKLYTQDCEQMACIIIYKLE